MNIIIQVLIVIVVAWLIVSYLIPLLPSPFSVIFMVILVIALILWLMRIAGLSF